MRIWPPLSMALGLILPPCSMLAVIGLPLQLLLPSSSFFGTRFASYPFNELM